MRAALAIVLAAVLGFSGCMSEQVVLESPRKVDIAGVEVDAAPLAEALLAEVRGVKAVSLQGSWNDNAFSAECVLKGDGEELSVVFLAPQMRLATLRLHRPCVVEWERSPMVPEAFKPEYAIFDLAVFYLPVPALRRALGPAFSVTEVGTTRRVCHGGDAVVSIIAQKDGGAKLENALWEYEYVVKEIR